MTRNNKLYATNPVAVKLVGKKGATCIRLLLWKEKIKYQNYMTEPTAREREGGAKKKKERKKKVRL